MAKKKGAGGWFVILIFVIFFIAPMLSSLGSLFGGFVFIAIVPIVIFIIVIFVIFRVMKSIPEVLEKFNNMPGQEITIPTEFFEQDKPVMETHSGALFKDLYGRKIIYYENGNPVYEKHN